MKLIHDKNLLKIYLYDDKSAIYVKFDYGRMTAEFPIPITELKEILDKCQLTERGKGNE